MRHLVVAVAMVLAFAGSAMAQNFAPEGYVLNAAGTRYERPGQPERGIESPGDSGNGAAGDSGASSGSCGNGDSR